MSIIMCAKIVFIGGGAKSLQEKQSDVTGANEVKLPCCGVHTGWLGNCGDCGGHGHGGGDGDGDCNRWLLLVFFTKCRFKRVMCATLYPGTIHGSDIHLFIS